MMSLKTLFSIRPRFNRYWFNCRWAGALAVAAAIAGSLAMPAFADDDPPALVGRLATIDGTVSFHTKDETTWAAATPNYPITSGNALWADANSHAGIQLGANDVSLGSQSELDVDHLDDQTFQASLPQGTVYLNLRALSNGDQVQIATPRGTVNINQPGRYEVYSGDQTHPSTVTVLEGAAQVSGDNNLNLPVAAGQTGVLQDNGQGGPVSATIAQAPAGEDELMAWARSREPQPVAAQAAPPPETVQMTGAQDLGRYGSWSASPEYGNVWYPQVAEDWVPYRSGHWAWVAPWGWTWVDDAPWGFAPFHYGRWVRIGHRWCWAPRPVVVVGAPLVPVYAPALVTFVGDIGGIGVSVSLGGPSVGWVPLGPREVYYPPYRVSERYVRNVNVTYVKNVNIINVHNTTVINNNVTVNHFVNHDAVTVVSRDTMTRSQRVSGNIQHVDQRQLDQMRGYNNRQAPLTPTAQTAGLTPTEAKHYGVPADQLQRKSSAGPRIQGNGNRNWTQRTPSTNAVGQSGQVQTNNRQQNQQLQTTNPQQLNQPGAEQQNRQNKWADRGSRKPGSAVMQPNAQQPGARQPGGSQLQGSKGQQFEGQPGNGQAQPSGHKSNNGQNNDFVTQQNTTHQQDNTRQGQQNQDQQKMNWANSKQSRQPGAPVQSPSAQPQAVHGQQQNLQQVPQENGQPVQTQSKQNRNNQNYQPAMPQVKQPQSENKVPGQSNRQATDWQARYQQQQYEQNQRKQQQQVERQQQMQQQQQRAEQQQMQQRQERAVQQQQVERQQQQMQQQQQRAEQQQLRAQQQFQQQENQRHQSQGGQEQPQRANQSSHQQQQFPQVQQLQQQ